MSEFVRKN